MKFVAIIFLSFLFLTPLLAGPRDILSGPIRAEVIKIRDGDSIDVRAHIWPGHSVEVSVRLRGIDAPELRAQCDQEHTLATAARQRLEELVGDQDIWLSDISGGKYYGRVLAQVQNLAGKNLQKALLDENLVRSYRGGKRRSWCRDDPIATGSVDTE